jgi:hypothetical protein
MDREEGRERNGIERYREIERLANLHGLLQELLATL